MLPEFGHHNEAFLLTETKISGFEMLSLIGFVKKPDPVHEENFKQTCRVGRQFVSCS